MVASSALDAGLLARLHKRARADRWALSVTAFAAALDASVRRAFDGTPPDRRQLEKYLDSLHLDDLALAWACADGSDAAWEHVMREHRPALYRAADAIDPSSGREIADSLWAELFGLTERDGERRSHFRYFHGRSTLATWLRAVLAQRHVDRVRSHRRLDVLPDDEGAASLPAPAMTMNPARDRHLAVMRRAVLAAVAALVPRDRLRLTCYYAQDLTLAQIGRALGEHEATVSRHLTRTRRAIRSAVEHELADRERMNEAEVAECFASVLDDPGSLDIADLLGSDASRKEVGQHRSTDKETSGAAGG